MSQTRFDFPASPATAELIVRKSRFLAQVFPLNDPGDIAELRARIRSEHPDARHQVAAWIAGPPDSPHRGSDDDGEPSGTAGKPIMRQLEFRTIGNIVLLITRYFGGIKLGASGLSRAYGNAAAQVLDQTTLATAEPMRSLHIQIEYRHEHSLRTLLAEYETRIEHMEHLAQVECRLQIPARQCEDLCRALTDATNGQIAIRQPNS